jgi:hypothetical protein
MPKGAGKRKKGAKRGKPPAEPYKVFISHSSSEKWIARQIAKEIGALGVETWLDEKDIKGGDVWPDKIMQGIDACNEGLVLVSAKSAKSWWVAYEIGGLRAQRKIVTPVLNDVKIETLPSIKDVQAIDLNEFEKFLEQLKARLNLE